MLASGFLMVHLKVCGRVHLNAEVGFFFEGVVYVISNLLGCMCRPTMPVTGGVQRRRRLHSSSFCFGYNVL